MTLYLKANDNNLNSIQKFKEKNSFHINISIQLSAILTDFYPLFMFFNDKRNDFALDINCRVDLKKTNRGETTWAQFCPFLTATYLYVGIFNSEHGPPTTSSFPRSH